MTELSLTRRESSLATLPVHVSAPGQYRVPLTLALLGLLLISIQAGQPLVAFCIMMLALGSTGALAWRTLSRRYAPALLLRERGDERLLEGRYVDARLFYERSLAIASRELPPGSPEILLNYYSLAAVNSMLQEHAEARDYLNKLLQGLHHRVPKAWSGHVAWLMRRVAHHDSTQGRHRDAIMWCERALDLVGEAPGADDNTVRSVLDDLGWLHHQSGDYAAAEGFFREALAVHEEYRDIIVEHVYVPRRHLGGQSPYRAPSPVQGKTSGGIERALAYTLLGLGWTLYERGSYELARQSFQRGQLVIAGVRTSSEPQMVGALLLELHRGLGAIEMTLGHYQAAAACYAQGQGHLLGLDAPVQAAALAIDLGWLARSCERFEQAEQSYDEAERWLVGHPEGASLMCSVFEGRAELERRRRRFRDANRQIRLAMQVAEVRLGTEHPRRASVLAVASRIQTKRSEYAEAERLARQCLQILRASLGRGHPGLADGYLALGEVQLAKGQFGAAEKAFDKAIELRTQGVGRQHPELADALEGKAAVFRATSRRDGATELMQLAADLRASVIRSAGEPPMTEGRN